MSRAHCTVSRPLRYARTRLAALIAPALIATALLSLGLPAFALTLPEALDQLDNRTGVLSAANELQDAETNLDRVTKDPLALRTDLVQAEQRLELAESQLEATRYSTMSEIVTGYTGALSAETQLALAQESLRVSEQALSIAQIRLESGSSTAQDASDAEAAVTEAESVVGSATEARDLALGSLSSLLGVEVEPGSLETVPDTFLTDVPPLDETLANAEGHPDLLSAEQQEDLARLATDVLDPLYAPESEIESAASGLQNAEAGLRETRRGFLLNVRRLHVQAENARKTLALRRSSLTASRARLQTEAQRLSGGLISQLAYERAKLETAQVTSDAEAARTAYLSALLELQAGSLTPLRGPYATATSRSGE